MTELAGGWEEGYITAEGITLPSVVLLETACGLPPFSAFPNLSAVHQSGAFAAAGFADMTQHCTRLQRLRVVKRPGGTVSFSRDPLDTRIAALNALSALTRLSRLDFVLQDEYELLALVESAKALLPSGLLQLGVLTCSERQFRCSALMTLGKLQGLHVLQVQLTGVTATNMIGDVRNFLNALSSVDVLYLYVDEQVHVGSCKDAEAALKRLGLACPKTLVLKVY